MSRAGIYVSFRLAIGNVLRESKWECSLVGNVPEKYNMVFSFLKFDLLEMLLGYAIWYSSVKMWSIPWELNEDGTVWEAIFSYYLNSFTSSNEYCSIEETTHFLWETLSLIYIDWDGGYLPSVRYPQSVRCLANIRRLSDIRWISFCHFREHSQGIQFKDTVGRIHYGLARTRGTLIFFLLWYPPRRMKWYINQAKFV